MRKIDFYVDIIDNFWDLWFAINLASILYKWEKNINIRFFSNNELLFKNMIKEKKNIWKIKYHDLSEIKLEASALTVYKTTLENLQAAIAGEHYEYTEMYPEFARIAEQENLSKISARFMAIAKAEQHHEERYKKLLAQLEANTIFKKNTEVVWICRECGYAHTGATPPDKCPSCDHLKAFYQVKCEEY